MTIGGFPFPLLSRSYRSAIDLSPETEIVNYLALLAILLYKNT
jgi:hypothetical protein